MREAAPPIDTLTASEGAVSSPVLYWLRVEGLLVLTLSVLLYRQAGMRWWVFFGLLLTPDVAMLAYLVHPKLGGISYNIVHSYVLPVGLACAAIVTHKTGTIPFVCIWTAHIGMDRAFGYGLKYPAAFGRTHLGVLGRRQ